MWSVWQCVCVCCKYVLSVLLWIGDCVKLETNLITRWVQPSLLMAVTVCFLIKFHQWRVQKHWECFPLLIETLTLVDELKWVWASVSTYLLLSFFPDFTVNAVVYVYVYIPTEFKIMFSLLQKHWIIDCSFASISGANWLQHWHVLPFVNLIIILAKKRAAFGM